MKSECYSFETRVKESNQRIIELENKLKLGDTQYSDMKNGMNKDINNILEKLSNLKMKYDDVCLCLRQCKERLDDKCSMNFDLDLKTKHMTEELNVEISRIHEENSRKRDLLNSLEVDNRNLSEAIEMVSNINHTLENDLATLRNTHDFSVNEFSEKIRKLEQDNYNLQKIKEDLQRN